MTNSIKLKSPELNQTFAMLLAVYLVIEIITILGFYLSSEISLHIPVLGNVFGFIMTIMMIASFLNMFAFLFLSFYTFICIPLTAADLVHIVSKKRKISQIERQKQTLVILPIIFFIFFVNFLGLGKQNPLSTYKQDLNEAIENMFP